MEECFDNLDISYEGTESSNQTQTKQIEPLKQSETENKQINETNTKAPTLTTNIDEYFSDDADLFNTLFNKDSSEIDLFLNTLNSFAQKKSKLIELLKSLSTIKTDSPNSYDSLLSNDSLKIIHSGSENTPKYDEENFPNLTSETFDKKEELNGEFQLTQSDNLKNIFVSDCQKQPSDDQEALNQLTQQVWTPLFPENISDENNNNSEKVDLVDQVKMEIKENQQVLDDQLADQIEWTDQMNSSFVKMTDVDKKAGNIPKENKHEDIKVSLLDSTVASTLSVILQRCQGSLEGTLLQELDDEEELMRDATIPDENETDENIDDEFMEDDDFVATEKALDHEVTSNSLAFERGLQRMRELNRRHVSQHYSNSSSAQKQTYTDSHDNNNTRFQNAQHHDEFVLKCQFSALIPAFDPRPGKNNINQIQDISVPSESPPSTSQQKDTRQQPETINANSKQIPVPKVDLFLRVENPTSDNNNNGLDFIQEEIKLDNKNATIFQYIQNLISLSQNKEMDKKSNNMVSLFIKLTFIF